MAKREKFWMIVTDLPHPLANPYDRYTKDEAMKRLIEMVKFFPKQRFVLMEAVAEHFAEEVTVPTIIHRSEVL